MHRWSPSQFERYIRACCKTPDAIIVSRHALDRMRERGVTRLMLDESLLCGRIRRPPEQSIKTGSFECRLEHYVAGQHVAAIAAVSEQFPGLVVVTVMTLEMT